EVGQMVDAVDDEEEREERAAEAEGRDQLADQIAVEDRQPWRLHATVVPYPRDAPSAPDAAHGPRRPPRHDCRDRDARGDARVDGARTRPPRALPGVGRLPPRPRRPRRAR